MSKEARDWLEKMARLDYIRPEAIPDIELYMDQVTTFMETELAMTKRTPDDKIMTKTMINNYTKNKLLPPPDKKKYSKDHMYMLIFIYYYKSIMSISDIQKIMTPLSGYCFGKDKMTGDETGLSSVYENMFSMMHEYYYPMKENIEKVKELTGMSFPEEEGEKGEFLRKLALITMLCYDVFMRKQMIETLIDEM